MKKTKIVKVISAILIMTCVCSCSISRNGKRESLADKLERKHRQRDVRPPRAEMPDPPKPPKKPRQGKLMDYCEGWLGTPYRGGGETKQGVDCSGFVLNVYKDVYGIKLPRRSQDMEQACKTTKNLNELKEGDLVFFNNKAGGSTNHVGIFLNKDTFVHASTSKGVTISRFEEKYWAERFRCGGKHPLKK